jgi:predicted kinase
MSKNQEAYDNCFKDLMRSLKKRESVVWDATNTTRKIRRRLVDVARQNGIEVVMIHFDLPLDIILERNKNRDRVVPEDVVVKYYQQIQSPKSYEYDHLLVINETFKL